MKSELARKAHRKAGEIRKTIGADNKNPICVYDLCETLGITVRFVDINMEGMYVAGGQGEIWLSALRPFARRVYTCAHELGHHVFGHGLRIDELIASSSNDRAFDANEFLVDSFAGHLLMPTVGVHRAFARRGINVASATPSQIYRVACSFGVGYETILAHLTYALRLLSPAQRHDLSKAGPKAIRDNVLGRNDLDRLIIADQQWEGKTIDAEVGTQLLVPPFVHAQSKILSFQGEHGRGRLYRAERPGVCRLYSDYDRWAVFVRVSRFQFVGLSKFRHLEEVEDEQ